MASDRQKMPRMGWRRSLLIAPYEWQHPLSQGPIGRGIQSDLTGQQGLCLIRNAPFCLSPSDSRAAGSLMGRHKKKIGEVEESPGSPFPLNKGLEQLHLLIRQAWKSYRR